MFYKIFFYLAYCKKSSRTVRNHFFNWVRKHSFNNYNPYRVSVPLLATLIQVNIQHFKLEVVINV